MGQSGCVRGIHDVGRGICSDGKKYIRKGLKQKKERRRNVKI
jgi:hypothetical protein